MAYSTREYTYDNDMTELIRHTIEFMKSKRYGQSVLGLDQETIDNVKSIISLTPSYNKNERGAIIGKNLRHKSHPYYTEYQPLQCLCLQILRMEEVKYGETDEEICGILFDGTWLWEEYLNTILQKNVSDIQRTRNIKVESICLKIIVESVIQISIKMILFSMQNTRSLKIMKKFQK